MSQRPSQSKILQRQKQIDYGKNTVGYEKYLKLVPRSKRGPTDPKTPNIYISNSKRAFDGIVKKWRRELHRYDRENVGNFLVNNSEECAMAYSPEASHVRRVCCVCISRIEKIEYNSCQKVLGVPGKESWESLGSVQMMIPVSYTHLTLPTKA